MSILNVEMRKVYSVGKYPSGLRKLRHAMQMVTLYANVLEEEIAELTAKRCCGFQYAPLPYNASRFSFETTCAVCDKKMQTQTIQYMGSDHSQPIPGTGCVVNTRRKTGKQFTWVRGIKYKQVPHITWKTPHIIVYNVLHPAVPIKDGTIFHGDGAFPVCSEICKGAGYQILSKFEQRRNTEWLQIEQARKLLTEVRVLLQERKQL